MLICLLVKRLENSSGMRFYGGKYETPVCSVIWVLKSLNVFLVGAAESELLMLLKAYLFKHPIKDNPSSLMAS